MIKLFIYVLVIVASISQSGCTLIELSSLNDEDFAGDYFISPQRYENLKNKQFKPEQPIARELRIFYISQSTFRGKEHKPRIYTDEENIKDTKTNKYIIPAVALAQKNSNSDNKSSKQLHGKAKQASRHERAKQYSMTLAPPPANQSLSRAESVLYASSAIVDLYAAKMEAELKASQKAHAKFMTDYIDAELGMIGVSAPEGSVLHVFLYQDDHVDVRPLKVVSNHLAVMAVEYRDGTVLSSSGEHKWYKNSGQADGGYLPPDRYVKYPSIENNRRRNSAYTDVQIEADIRNNLLEVMAHELYQQRKSMLSNK